MLKLTGFLSMVALLACPCLCRLRRAVQIPGDCRAGGGRRVAGGQVHFYLWRSRGRRGGSQRHPAPDYGGCFKEAVVSTSFEFDAPVRMYDYEYDYQLRLTVTTDTEFRLLALPRQKFRAVVPIIVKVRTETKDVIGYEIDRIDISIKRL